MPSRFENLLTMEFLIVEKRIVKGKLIEFVYESELKLTKGVKKK